MKIIGITLLILIASLTLKAQDSTYHSIPIFDSTGQEWVVRYSFILKDSLQVQDSSGRTIYAYKSHAQIFKLKGQNFIPASSKFVVTFHKQRSEIDIAKRDFKYAIRHNLITTTQ